MWRAFERAGYKTTKKISKALARKRRNKKLATVKLNGKTKKQLNQK
jgi:hypothetical protein